MTGKRPASRQAAESREAIRKRATIAVLSLQVLGVIGVVLVLPGVPSQPTVLLSIFAGTSIALYLVEVWARSGRLR